MMRSMRAVATLALLVMPLTAAAQQKSTGGQAPSASSEPTLADTLSYIRQTLESYGRIDWTGLPEGFHGYITFKLSSGAPGCNIDVSLDSFSSPQKWQAPVRLEGDVYEMNLASIDPQTVATNEYESSIRGYMVHLTTTNNSPAILKRIVFFAPNISGSSAEGQISHQGDVAIGVTTPTSDGASRLAKAYTHAVVLCGGKSSPF